MVLFYASPVFPAEAFKFEKDIKKTSLDLFKKMSI